jgi:acetylornithine deacetylase/succinyl-diaminopimelate desuccinylase-like protein
VTSDELAQLCELLRIASVAGDEPEIARAVDWVCDLIAAAPGATIERRRFDGVALGVGTIAASRAPATAPTVLLYGHVDVQPPGRLADWSADPFDPQIRDGWLYARGAADDKGPFYALLRAATGLAAEAALPVNVRILCDTEEEVGGRTAVRYLQGDRSPLDACVILDTVLHAPGEPVIVTGTRGIASLKLVVRVRDHDLHSGTFGGVAINAASTLVSVLDALTGGGRGLPAVLRQGVLEPTAAELESWAEIDAIELLGPVGAVGAVGVEPGVELLRRLWAEPAVDIHGLSAGITTRELNIVPGVAEAIVSVRVAPGQDADAVGEAAAELLRVAVPASAELELEVGSRTPPSGPFDPDSPPLRAARVALERGFGRPAVLARSGGSLPILAALSKRGVPAILSGLALPDSRVHGVDERLRLDHLTLGLRAARELLVELGGLT